MTKKQCKNKVAKLREKRLEIDEQIIHFERQTKLLDAEDSQRLLKKYHIESEELADLLMNRDSMNQIKKQRARAAARPKPVQEQETDTAEIATKTLPESKEKTILGKPQTEQQLQTDPEQAAAPKVQSVKEPHSSIMDSFLKEAAQ